MQVDKLKELIRGRRQQQQQGTPSRAAPPPPGEHSDNNLGSKLLCLAINEGVHCLTIVLNYD